MLQKATTLRQKGKAVVPFAPVPGKSNKPLADSLVSPPVESGVEKLQ
jgi:hypothetical protein